MTTNQKPGVLYWIISILALLWNIMGVIAYLGQAYMTDDVLKALPQNEQDWYANVPAWVTAAFAVAVFSAFIACIGLLLRKSWSTKLFTLSFLAVLVQQLYNFFIQDYVEITGLKVVLPIVTVIIAGFLMWYSKGLKLKGVLS